MATKATQMTMMDRRRRMMEVKSRPDDRHGKNTQRTVDPLKFAEVMEEVQV